MHIEWNTILNSALTFIILIILKVLLDFKIAQICIKYLSWIPLRNFFREKPINIAGTWDQIWDSTSMNFKSETDRHGHPNIKQMGNYCYTEFISKSVTYIVFCRVVGQYFVGDWYDKKDAHGYFGTFQLELVNSNKMKGLWIGHSKTVHEVNSGLWEWNKVN